MDNNNTFQWLASGNAPLLFPTELVTGKFLFEDMAKVDIPESTPFAADWGEAVSMHLSTEKQHPAPKYIIISWLSIVENKFYAVADELPQEEIAALLSEKDEKTNKPKYDTLIAGMAPYGQLAIWLSGNGITTEVAWLQGKDINFKMKDFAPNSTLTQEAYSKAALAESEEALANFQKNNLPDPTLFNRYMQKFNYRITPTFEDKAELTAIELSYYNGERNTTQSGEHAENAMRAKPRKITLHWHIKKVQYSAYFWSDEKKITDIFDQFYKENAQQNGELLIEVGASNQDFKFILRDKFVEMEIPVTEVIVFKNKFEFFRSKEYNKPKGGWKNV
ncbi:MAG: DUF2931 family protein [Bacteroidales bacterium]|nr:DUF2931 family protein [Bacteroidales bacterium]